MSQKQIENYYDVAMDIKLNEGNDFPNGLGAKIKHDWIQEIWDKVNPGVKILSHHLETGPLDLNNDWVGSQYTIIVCLTPDMKPEDGGSLELWTPNLTDKMKAMACNTLYTFNADEEKQSRPSLLILAKTWPSNSF